MMQYYYTDGITKHGPFSFEEIQAKDLAPATLVWHDNLPDWTRVADLPEFRAREIPKAPPPLPTTGARMQQAEEATNVSALLRRYRWLLVWCIFHVVALLLSTNEVTYFNSAGAPKTDKFWPFVKFTEAYFTK